MNWEGRGQESINVVMRGISIVTLIYKYSKHIRVHMIHEANRMIREEKQVDGIQVNGGGGRKWTVKGQSWRNSISGLRLLNVRK